MDSDDDAKATAGGNAGEREESLRSWYLRERYHIDDREAAACSSFDKYLITLASGSLGLSVLFFEKFGVPINMAAKVVLVIAWLCFGASLAFTLVSFRLDAKAWFRRREILDFDFKREDGGRPRAGERKYLCEKDDDKRNPFNRWIDRLNLWSLWAFLVGVALFLCSAACTLCEEGHDGKEKTAGHQEGDQGAALSASPKKEAEG